MVLCLLVFSLCFVDHYKRKGAQFMNRKQIGCFWFFSQYFFSLTNKRGFMKNILFLLLIVCPLGCASEQQPANSQELGDTAMTDLSIVDDGDHSAEYLFPNGLVFPEYIHSDTDLGTVSDFGVDAEIVEDAHFVDADFIDTDDEVMVFPDAFFEENVAVTDMGVFEDLDQSVEENRDEGLGALDLLETEEEIPFGNTSVLEVRRISPPLQVVEVVDVVGGNAVSLAEYEFCATTQDPVNISLIEFGFLQDGVLDIHFGFSDMPLSQHRVSYYTTLTIFRESGEELVVAGNACETVTIQGSLPAEGSYVEVYILGIATSQDHLYYGGDSWYRVDSVRTIFELSELYRVFVESRHWEVPRSVDNFWLADFVFEGYDNAQATLSSLDFRISMSGDLLPLSYVVWYQTFAGDSFRLTEYSDIFSDNDVFTVETLRPDGASEDISFGASLRIGFSLLFCPEDLETFQIHLESVETSAELENIDRDSLEPEFFSPLFEVVEEDSVLPHLLLSYFGKYGSDQAQYFLWPEGFYNDCAIQNERNGLCPVLGLRLRGVVPDERFPILFNALQFEVSGQMLQQDLEFRVILKDAFGRSLRDEEIAFSQGNVAQVIDVSHPILLDRGVDEVFLFVYLDEIPQQDPNRLLGESFTIRLLSADAQYLDSPTPVFIHAKSAPGVWPWGLQDLPYVGPRMVLASPEVWLESNIVGRPQVVQLGGENFLDMELLNMAYSNDRDSVFLCNIVFQHNTGKESPVFGSIDLDFGNETFALADWDRERATFYAPDGFCHFLETGWQGHMTVVGRDPSSVTLPNQPLQLELVEFGMHPVGMPEYEVPFVVGFEDGQKFFLGEEAAPRVRGRVVQILD